MDRAVEIIAIEILVDVIFVVMSSSLATEVLSTFRLSSPSTLTTPLVSSSAVAVASKPRDGDHLHSSVIAMASVSRDVGVVEVSITTVGGGSIFSGTPARSRDAHQLESLRRRIRQCLSFALCR